MSHDPLKNLRCVPPGGAQFGVQVLQFQLFLFKVLAEPAKRAGRVLVAILIVELVVGDAFPHGLGVFFQPAAHVGDLRRPFKEYYGQ